MSFTREVANPSSTTNQMYRFNREQEARRDAERRARVNKEYERALSSSSESESTCKCKCKCNAPPRSKELIEYERDLDRRLAVFDRKCREQSENFRRSLREESICTIL